jgi:hypothetical protein
MKQEPTWLMIWKLIVGVLAIYVTIMAFISVGFILDTVTEWGRGEITGREMVGEIAGRSLYFGLLATWKFVSFSGIDKAGS